MIEVTLRDVGQVLAWAEAEDPEAALVAARTLWDDMVGVPYYGKLTLEIRVGDRLVYSGSAITDADLRGGR